MDRVVKGERVLYEPKTAADAIGQSGNFPAGHLN
jgi:hypothetical protein